MRVQILLEMSANGTCLPIAYRQYIQAAIYSALQEHQAYAEQLHNYGTASKNGHVFKLFTFSQLEGAYQVSGRRICFSGSVRLEIRSIYDELIMYLFSRFSRNAEFQIAGKFLTITGCWLSDKRLNDTVLNIVTRSPVVAYRTCEDRKTIFYSPKDPEFYELICANAQRKWQSLHDNVEPILLQITPLPDCCYTKQVTSFKDTRITAWSGSFHLAGDCNALDFLFQTGLGAKNSQGFGMFDPLNA